ncbi:OprD family porin [Pseudomonas sp. SDO5271_S396]
MRKLFVTSLVSCASLASTSAMPVRAEGFIADSHGTLELRNYYFNDGYRDGGEDRKEWAQGFLLDLQSGFTPGAVGFGLNALGLVGLRLDSSPTHADTGLLPVHDNGHAADEFSTLGLTAKVRVGDALIKSGTLLTRIPVMVYNDGRLVPQTFRGTQIEYTGIPDLYLHAGHLDKNKTRNSTDSVDMTPSGYRGNDGTDFDFSGATYKVSPNLSVTGYYGEMRDFYRQGFLGVVHKWQLGNGSLTSDLRYFDSGDAGRAYNGKVDADMFSGLFTYRLGGHALGFGYQKLFGDTALPYVNGGSVYSFSNASIGKFIQAGEKTWMARYDYDFAALGVPGLSLMTRYYKGDHGAYKDTEAREHETNTSLKYVMQGGTFKGFGTQLSHAISRSTYSDDRDNYRIYLTYEIALW